MENIALNSFTELNSVVTTYSASQTSQQHVDLAALQLVACLRKGAGLCRSQTDG